MRILAVTSLALNFLLAGMAGVIWLRPQEVTRVSAPVTAAAIAAPVAASSPQPKTDPFHWSQVESEDYATFTANLRRIGCPEETIRSIVTGEIGQIYQEKQKQHEARAHRPLLPSELQQFRQEQAAVLSQIISSTAAAAAATARGAAAAAPLSSGPAPRYPLALAPIPAAAPAAVNQLPSATSGGTSALPSESAAVAINQIRQGFVNDLGGPNQDPSDPLYLQRWSKAQREADDRMRSIMGASYYNHYSIEVGRKAYEDQHQGQ